MLNIEQPETAAETEGTSRRNLRENDITWESLPISD